MVVPVLLRVMFSSAFGLGSGPTPLTPSPPSPEEAGDDTSPEAASSPDAQTSPSPPNTTGDDAATKGAEADPQRATRDRGEFFMTEVALGSSIGIGVVNPKRLSAAWEDAGYRGFVPTHWTPFAINGELWIDRHVPALDLVRYQQARAEQDDGPGVTQLRYTITQLSYGYAVVHTHGFSFVPRLGFGIFDISNRVARRDADADFDFADLAADPGTIVNLEKSGMLVDFGLRASYLIEFTRKPPHPGMSTGIRIGLHVGGLVQLFDFGPQGRAWKVANQRVTGAPDMRLDGMYLRLFVAPSLIHRSLRANEPPPKRRRRR